MITPIDEAYAQLNLVQNLLGIIMATNLARCPEDESEAFKEKLVFALRNPMPSSQHLTPLGEQKEAEIRDRVVQLGEDFIRQLSILEIATRALIKRSER